MALNNIVDARYERLRTQFPAGPPHVNDLLMLWLANEGGTGNTLMDRWRSMLIGKGATPAPINDMWYQVLGLNGFTQNSLNDREFAFWTTSGDLTGTAATNVSLLSPQPMLLVSHNPTIVTTP